MELTSVKLAGLRLIGPVVVLMIFAIFFVGDILTNKIERESKLSNNQCILSKITNKTEYSIYATFSRNDYYIGDPVFDGGDCKLSNYYGEIVGIDRVVIIFYSSDRINDDYSSCRFKINYEKHLVINNIPKKLNFIYSNPCIVDEKRSIDGSKYDLIEPEDSERFMTFNAVPGHRGVEFIQNNISIARTESSLVCVNIAQDFTPKEISESNLNSMIISCLRSYSR